MNISPLTIYLWQLADKASNFFLAAAFVLGMTTACLALFITCPIDEAREVAKKAIKPSVILFMVISVLNVFIPSSSTIAMMVVIPEIAHSKVIQQDLPDIYNAAVDALKNQLKK